MKIEAAAARAHKVKFYGRRGFHTALRENVDKYFQSVKRSKNGDWRMHLKTAIIILVVVVSYIVLVFSSPTLVVAAIAAFAMSQGLALVGFNIMHDGNHGSYSSNPKINWAMGFTMDLIGASQMLWKQKHNILHHTYTNIEELDDDLHTSGLLRLSPDQKRHFWHRFQHWYAIPVYSLLTISWMGFADFQKFFTGRIGPYKLRKPSITESAMFFTTKLFYVGYMIVIPSFFHPVLHVLVTFVAIHLVLGVTLSVVFQLAHTVEGNTFPQPDTETGIVQNEWAVHEVETTADFAPRNWLVTWYLGGLNFQIEHHLFAKICHIHSPAICDVVEETCKEFGVRYVCYPTLTSALAAHFRFLKAMGKPAAA